MQVFALFLASTLACHHEHGLLLGHGQFVLRKAGHREGDVVLVFADLGDVIGKPAIRL